MTQEHTAIEVTQADRDAAAPFQVAMGEWRVGRRFMGDVLVEAFARHRRAQPSITPAPPEQDRSTSKGEGE